MGFGLGAFFMGQIAPPMIAGFKVVDEAGIVTSSGVANTFYIWGFIFLILVTGAAQFYKNPPAGWLPKGFTPSATATSAAGSFMFGEAVKTPQWWMLWLMLGLNVSAGLGLISQLSPISQELYKPLLDPSLAGDAIVKKLAWAGGLAVAITAIFNGLGRLFWAKISDNIGRKSVFATMFITQAPLYPGWHGTHKQLLVLRSYRLLPASLLRRWICHDARFCRGLLRAGIYR
jgi:OFA family oxalate/formate antiporter-like MFS transporter